MDHNLDDAQESSFEEAYELLSKEFRSDYAAHAAQLEPLAESVRELAAIGSRIPVETHPSLSFTVQRVQVRHFLRVIDELNAVICHSLSLKFTGPAEALARISIEMSVNLLFILNDAPHARSKGLLDACIAARKSRAKKWYKFASTAGLTGSMTAANELLRTTEVIEQSVISSARLPTARWPSNSREKFKAVGLEEAYCTHFQSSSDSVHLLGEDILNLTLAEFFPIEGRQQFAANIAGERLSFAVYLLIQAVLFHCEALLALFELLRDCDEVAKRVEHIASTTQAFHSQHEDDHKEHRSAFRDRFSGQQ